MAAKLDVGAEQIMARVRSVLDPYNIGKITEDQTRLFEYVSAQLFEYGREPKNPMVGLVDHVGNYWRHWLLLILNTGTYRPSTIIKLLHALIPDRPISHKMLTFNLRLLERDGLVERYILTDEFKHVEYSVTTLGAEFADLLIPLVDWVAKRAAEVARARARFDAADRD